MLHRLRSPAHLHSSLTCRASVEQEERTLHDEVYEAVTEPTFDDERLKTVKLRIAVVVDAKGRWSAAGWSYRLASDDSEATRMRTARDNLYSDPDDDLHLPTAEYVVETEVEVPNELPRVVQGMAKAFDAESAT